jgi:hypothetical protein
MSPARLLPPGRPSTKASNEEKEEIKGHPEAGWRLVAPLAVPKGEKLV